eukprot:SAG31_NODE_1438_length_8338_cov_18.446413_7_plen_169_part_00
MHAEAVRARTGGVWSPRDTLADVFLQPRIQRLQAWRRWRRRRPRWRRAAAAADRFELDQQIGVWTADACGAGAGGSSLERAEPVEVGFERVEVAIERGRRLTVSLRRLVPAVGLDNIECCAWHEHHLGGRRRFFFGGLELWEHLHRALGGADAAWLFRRRARWSGPLL